MEVSYIPATNSGTRIKSRVTKAGQKKLQNEVKVGKLFFLNSVILGCPKGQKGAKKVPK
jgi:hypothetical protein